MYVIERLYHREVRLDGPVFLKVETRGLTMVVSYSNLKVKVN